MTPSARPRQANRVATAPSRVSMRLSCRPMDDQQTTPDSWPVHFRDLERREADLRHMLERCVPPVDQHRRELERVRAEMAAVRAQESGHTS